MSEKKAKPCPFCGKPAHVSGSGEFCYASCDDTQCILGLHGYDIEDWNRRVMPPEVKALLSEVLRAWDAGVKRWRTRHESIPAAFVELACVLDEVQRVVKP